MKSVRILAVLVLGAVPALASPVLTVTTQSIVVTPGDVADQLEIDITNASASSVTIAGFFFEISTTNASIDFTDATTATVNSPYIFAGNSLFGPDILVSPGQTLDAGDNYAIANAGVSVAAGATYSIGEVFVSIDGGSSLGPNPITFTAAATSFSDPAGNLITYSTSPGTIIVQVAVGSAPEPSTLWLAATALAGLVAVCRRLPA